MLKANKNQHAQQILVHARQDVQPRTKNKNKPKRKRKRESSHLIPPQNQVETIQGGLNEPRHVEVGSRRRVLALDHASYAEALSYAEDLSGAINGSGRGRT